MPKVMEIFLTKPRNEWRQLFKEVPIPSAPVNDFADPVNNPQVIADEHMVELDDPAHGKVPLLSVPVKPTNPSRCRRRIASCKP